MSDGEVKVPANLRVLMAHHLGQVVGLAGRNHSKVEIADDHKIVLTGPVDDEMSVVQGLNDKGIRFIEDEEARRNGRFLLMLVPKLNPYLEQETTPPGKEDATDEAECEGEGEGQGDGEDGDPQDGDGDDGGGDNEPDPNQPYNPGKNNPQGKGEDAKYVTVHGTVEVQRDDTRQQFKAVYMGSDKLITRATSRWMPSAIEAVKDLGITRIDLNKESTMLSAGKRDAKRKTTYFTVKPGVKLLIERKR